MGEPVRGLDMVRVTSVTEGTGTYSLGNAVTGYIAPASAPGVVSGGRYVFLVASANGQVWELVEGVLTAGSPYTLTRAQVVVTSAGNQTAINWSNSTHGARTMTCVARAGRSVLLDTDGLLPNRPAYAASRASGQQSIPSGAFTQLTFDTAENGTNVVPGLSIVSNTYIHLTVAGWYTFLGQVRWADNSTGARNLRLVSSALDGSGGFVHGSDLRSASTDSAQQVYGTFQVGTAGRRVYIDVLQNSGAALLTAPTNGALTRLAVVLG